MVTKGLYNIDFSTTNNTNRIDNIKLSTWSWMVTRDLSNINTYISTINNITWSWMVTKGLLDLACTISKSILTSYLLWKVKSLAIMRW